MPFHRFHSHPGPVALSLPDATKRTGKARMLVGTNERRRVDMSTVAHRLPSGNYAWGDIEGPTEHPISHKVEELSEDQMNGVARMSGAHGWVIASD